MNPPAAPLSRPRRPAAQKALNMIHNTYGVGTKRPRNTSTHQTNKARKRKRDHTPSQTPSQGDDTFSQYKPTPSQAHATLVFLHPILTMLSGQSVSVVYEAEMLSAPKGGSPDVANEGSGHEGDSNNRVIQKELKKPLPPGKSIQL
ncbi:uncharacterized protein Z518_04017 [Rhinocladiella mackenziei CBS 650.93]|uniref:Uncharacterized protein n=1 Tax=Rhinocladiella mackenziei CBS 650.93 TaxID=1442369 RepID=A0A0D2H6N7_9EURO|nr:uncharacterized protein Z518_04017 [Rhinocladiella mackenziei CBS 650.93]KIX06043.1 hypothetical protein Z518_04017 [Rhinocladiella mackenziei CBS 650.93]